MAEGKWTLDSNQYVYKIDDNAVFTISGFSTTNSETVVSKLTVTDVNSDGTSEIKITDASIFGKDDININGEAVFSDLGTVSSTTLVNIWDNDGTNALFYGEGSTSKYVLSDTKKTITQSWVTPAEIELNGVKSDANLTGPSEKSVTFNVSNIDNRTDGISIASADGYSFTFTGDSGTKIVIIDSDTYVTGTDNADTITTAFTSASGIVSINGGGGDDQITVSDVTITQASKVEGGAGSDTFVFSNVTVSASTTFNVSDSDGSETYTITNVSVGSDATFAIDDIAGNDTFNISSSTGISIGGTGAGDDTFIISSSTAVTIVSGANDSDSLNLDMAAGNIGISLSNFNATDIISLSSAASGTSTFDSGTGVVTFNFANSKKAEVSLGAVSADKLEDLYKMTVYNGGNTGISNTTLGNIVDPFVWNSDTSGGTYTALYGRKNSVSDTTKASPVFSITGLASATVSDDKINGLALGTGESASTVTISDANLLGESEVKITGTGYKFAITGALSNTSRAALWTYASETAALNTASLAASGTKLNYSTNADSTTIIFTPATSAFVIGGINSATKLTAVNAGSTIEISSNTYVSDTPMKITKNDGYSVSLGGASMLEVSAFASGTSIIGSSGADTITASGTTAVPSSIFGGNGSDSIVIEGLTFSGSGELYVSGDSGTDVFDITGINANGKLVVDGGADSDTFNITGSSGVSIVSSDADNFYFSGTSQVTINGLDKFDVISLAAEVTSATSSFYSTTKILKLGDVQINVANFTGNDPSSTLYGLKVYNGKDDKEGTNIEDLIDPMKWSSGTGNTYTFGRVYSETSVISIGSGLVDNSDAVLTALNANTSEATKTVTIIAGILGEENVSFSTETGYSVVVVDGTSNTRVAGLDFSADSQTAYYKELGSTRYSISDTTIVASDARVASVVIEGLNGANNTNVTSGTGKAITLQATVFSDTTAIISSGTGYTFTFNSAVGSDAKVIVGVSDVTVIGGAGADSIYAEGQNNISLNGDAGNDILVVNGSTGVSLYGGEDNDTFFLGSDATITDLATGDIISVSGAITSTGYNSGTKLLNIGSLNIKLDNLTGDSASEVYAVQVMNENAENTKTIGDLVDPMEWASGTGTSLGTYTYGRKFGEEQNLISIGSGLVGTSDTILDSLSGAMSETSTGATLQVEAGMLGTEEVAFLLASENYAVSLGTSGTSDTKVAGEEWKFSGSGSDTAVLFGAGTFTYTLGTNKITVSDSRASEVKLTGLSGANKENVTSDTGNVVTVASDAFVSGAAMTIVKGENYSFVFGEDGTKSANIIVADSNVTVTGTTNADTLAAANAKNISLFGNGGNDIFSISGGSDVTLVGAEDSSDTFVFSSNVTGVITDIESIDAISVSGATTADFSSTTHLLTIGNVNVSLGTYTTKEELATNGLYEVKVNNSLLGNIIDPIAWSSSTSEGVTTFTYGRQHGTDETGLITIGEGLADTVDSEILKNATANSTLTLTAAMISIPAADDSSKEDNGFIDNFASFEVNSELGYAVTFTNNASSDTATVGNSWIINDTSDTANFFTAGTLTYSISPVEGSAATISVSDTRVNTVEITGLINATSDSSTFDVVDSSVTVKQAFSSNEETVTTITKGEGYSFTFASKNGEGAAVEVASDVSNVTVAGSLGADTLSVAEGATNVSLFGGAGNDILEVVDGSDVTLTGGDGVDTFVLDGTVTGGAITDLTPAQGDKISLGSPVTSDTVEFNSTTKTLVLGDINVSINGITTAANLASLYGVTVYNGGDTEDDITTFGDLVDPMVWTSSDTASGTTFTFGRAYSETARISIGTGLQSSVTEKDLTDAMTVGEVLTQTVSINADMLGTDSVEFTVAGGYGVSLAADVASGKEREAGFVFSTDSETATYKDAGSTTYTISLTGTNGTITATDARTIGAQISGLNGADSTTVTWSTGNNISVGSSAIGSTAISIDSGTGYTFTFGSTAESGASVTAISNITVIGGEGADSLYAAVSNVSLNGGAGKDTLSINGNVTGVSLTGGAGSDTFLFNGAVSAAISDLSTVDGDSIRLGTSVASGTFEGGVLKLGNVSITANDITGNDFSTLYGLKVYNGATTTETTLVEDLIDPMGWASETGNTYTYGRNFGTEQDLISIGSGLVGSTTTIMETLADKTSGTVVTIASSLLGIEDVAFSVAGGYSVSLDGNSTERDAGWEINAAKTTAAYMNAGSTTYVIETVAGGGTITTSDTRTVGAQISGLKDAVSETTITLTEPKNISVAADAIGTTAISIDSGEGYTFTFGSAASGATVTAISNTTVIGGAGADSLYVAVGNVTLNGGAGNDTLSIINDGTPAITDVSLAGGDGSDTFVFNGSVSAAISNLSATDDKISIGGEAVTSETAKFEGGVLKLGNVSITANDITGNDFSTLYGLKVYNGATTTETTLVEDLIDVKEWDSQTGGTYTYGREHGTEQNVISIGSGLVGSTTTIMETLADKTSGTVVTIASSLLGIEDVAFTVASGYSVSLDGNSTDRDEGWEINDEKTTAAYMNSGTTTYSIVSAASGGTITASDTRTVGAQISGLNGASATTVSLTSNNNISVAAGAIGTTAISIDSGEGYTFTFGSTATKAANVVTKVDKVTIVGGAGADTFGFSGLTSISSATSINGGEGNDTFNISSVVGGGYLTINGGEGKDSISIANSTGISIVSEKGDTDTFVFDGASAATASISNFDTTDKLQFATAVASGSVTGDNSVQFTTADGGTINITLSGVSNVSDVYKATVYNGSNESLLEDIVDPYIWTTKDGENNTKTLTYARRTNTSDSLFAVVGLNTSLSVDSANNSVAGVTLNADSTVTIAQSALTTNDVSITTAFGYNLSLAADVKAPTSSDAVWSISGDGNNALYIAPMYASIAGYEIASVDTDSNGTSETTYIKYSEAGTPKPMATISGLDANGLKVESLTAATNGAYITFTNNMLPENKADVVITNAEGYTYKLKLAADAKTSTTDASWSVSSKKDVVIYTQESLKGGWELDGDSITAVDGKGGDKVSISGLYNAKLNAKKTVNGVTYDSGTSTFIISNSLLNNTLHTANVTGTTASVVASISAKDGVTGNDDSTYKVSLAADVPSYSTTREQYWDVPTVGTANYYADKGSIAGYNVVSGDETKIEFKAAQHPDVTISLAGLSNKATVKNDNISGLTVNSETSTVKIAANLVGTNGASITTSVKDYTYTLAGKGKLINAQANAVTLQGSTGNDTLQDTVTAAISLNGGKGNDVIIANGNDSVDMGAGNDAVTLSGGNNKVYYTAGKDTISGFSSTDSINIADKTVKESSFKSAALTLTIGTGSLTFKNTTVPVSVGGYIYDQNFVYDSLKSAVTVGAGYEATTLTSLASGVSSIDASKVAKGLNISLNSANALNIIGTSKKDTIYGSTGKDSLYGGAGNDVIYGGDGDSLTGGKDNDTFVYTGGNVIITDFDAKKDKISLSGGTASSLAVTNAAVSGDDLVLTLSDKKTITLKDKNSLAGSAITINNTAVIFGDNYIVDAKKTSATLNSDADGSKLTSYSSMITIDGSAATSNLTLTGNAKANKITAGSGNDILNGGKGNDTLVGGTGKDTFVYAVGEGKDVIADFTVGDKDQLSIVSGGNSADISVITGATYNSGNLALTIGKQAVTLQGSLSSAITINDKGYYFGENQIFDSGKTATTLYSAFKGSYDATTDTKVATIDGSGVTSAVQLTGNAINNTITGGKKNDTIDGGAGTDSINGGAGNDSLYGGAGDDALTGGAGKDVFAFKAGEGNDTITDYAAGDKIQFLDGSAKVTWSISGNDVVFKYGSGQITATDAAGKKITTVDSTGKTTTKKYDNATYTKTNGELYEASAASSKNFDLFEDNNFITDDTDLDSITDNKVAVTQIQDNKDEITQAQDLLTYSDDK